MGFGREEKKNVNTLVVCDGKASCSRAGLGVARGRGRASTTQRRSNAPRTLCATVYHAPLSNTFQYLADVPRSRGGCERHATRLRKGIDWFYGSPPNFSLTKSPVFETSSRPYILKYGAPYRPDVAVRQTFASTKMFDENAFFMVPFLVSSSLEMFLEENRRFRGGGGCRRSSPMTVPLSRDNFRRWCFYPPFIF